ncbi:MAG: hypothetical protein E4H14_09995 [Candidatus Thorarchaeota archaeon]|nr:MAG: hypothetical protein E4H14_09995 [Candidatus Thorarchaeota archaeon]
MKKEDVLKQFMLLEVLIIIFIVVFYIMAGWTAIIILSGVGIIIPIKYYLNSRNDIFNEDEPQEV